MWNQEYVTRREIGGQDFFVAAPGWTGTAVYGPYVEFPAGQYVAEFVIATEGFDSTRGDMVCGMIDVALDAGTAVSASMNLFTSRLRGFQRNHASFTGANTRVATVLLPDNSRWMDTVCGDNTSTS